MSAVPGNGPARVFRLPDAKGTLGFITPVSQHFCPTCNRLRLTADGKLRPCLLAEGEVDVMGALRVGASEARGAGVALARGGEQTGASPA